MDIDKAKVMTAPHSLYTFSLDVVTKNYTYLFHDEIRLLPNSLLLDTYYNLCVKKLQTKHLCAELSQLSTFMRLLKAPTRNFKLYRLFQTVIDHNRDVLETLAKEFDRLSRGLPTSLGTPGVGQILQNGKIFGDFLSDGGYYRQATDVFQGCARLCATLTKVQHQKPDERLVRSLLDCYTSLMQVQIGDCAYAQCDETWTQLQQYLDCSQEYNKASLYISKCALLFCTCAYKEAFQYCIKALREVECHHRHMLPAHIVDVFRIASKACVVKREFKKAELCIKFACEYAIKHFGDDHQKYADALIDYGFYLLNVDQIGQSKEVYGCGLNIRKKVFGGNNLLLAIAHEDFAYSTYVYEYSTGNFSLALEHASYAKNVISYIVPEDHLLLASPKRVKALILEEVAIDTADKKKQSKLLEEACSLHNSSLRISFRAFGETNIQTAKHYGNLGRLYQSMGRHTDAEEMHLTAIRIKEELLGLDDYEVALSLGHLASLYNYDMKRYDEAEKLYLRSIEIGKKLFGKGYSGLEYDYRGLLQIYTEQDRIAEYQTIAICLQEWKHLRDTSRQEKVKPLEFSHDLDIQEVLTQFFSSETQHDRNSQLAL